MLRGDLLCPVAQPVREVVAADVHFPPVRLHSPYDDVGVRMPRVVMVRRDPVSLYAEIPRDAVHKILRVGGEVQVAAILGGNDQLEGPGIPTTGRKKVLTTSYAFRPIERVHACGIPLDVR